MKFSLNKVSKFLALLSLFIFILLWADSTQMEPFCQSFYDKYDIEFPTIFADIGKKCLDILAGLLWFFKEHESTNFDSLIMFICLASSIFIQYYFEEPTSGYIAFGFFLLLILWICYYFW